MAKTQTSSLKLRFSILGFISGAMFGGGGLLLMQQSGKIALTTAQTTSLVMCALLFGVVFPTLIHWTIRTLKRPAPVAVTAIVFLAAFAGSMGIARPAAAQSCALTVNGQSVAAGTTVTIAEGDDLTVAFDGIDITGGSAAVKFGPVQVFTDSFTLTEPRSGSEVRTFDRSKITDKGVGLYAIDAVVNTSGSDCQFDFLIHVEGDPLGTPAGMGAAAALGVGALGSLAALGREIASALAQAKAALV